MDNDLKIEGKEVTNLYGIDTENVPFTPLGRNVLLKEIEIEKGDSKVILLTEADKEPGETRFMVIRVGRGVEDSGLCTGDVVYMHPHNTRNVSLAGVEYISADAHMIMGVVDLVMENELLKK